MVASLLHEHVNNNALVRRHGLHALIAATMLGGLATGIWAGSAIGDVSAMRPLAAQASVSAPITVVRQPGSVAKAVFSEKSDRPILIKGRFDRHGTRQPAMRSAAKLPQPLAPDAFDRRFLTAVSPGAGLRFAASRILRQPETGEMRTAFTVRPANGTLYAAAFHRIERTDRPMPAGETAVAFADDEIAKPQFAVLRTGVPSEAQSLPAVPAIGGTDDARPPVVLASLGQAIPERPSEMGLPDSVSLPNSRPGIPLKQALAPRPVLPKKAMARTAPPSRNDDPVARTLAPMALSPRMSTASVGAPVRGDSRPAVAALAYARPDDAPEKPLGSMKAIPWPGGGKKVAIYDISAQVVHMPNGDRLEAHSGQGSMRDNPKYVTVKMRGPTPPSTYRLSMREKRFFGVEALRMTPVDGVNPHGRVGLLTHSYLRRRPGDSAGCIAFKDYPRFLAAYKRGEVNQVVVVASMGAMAKARAGAGKFAALFTGGSR